MTDSRKDYCRGCRSTCCRYFTVPLETPEDADDFDAMRWYILHEGVSIYVDDEGDWYVNVDAPCRALADDNRCRIYDARPDVCRDHTDEACEEHGGEYDFREHFRNEEALMAYARAFLARKEASRSNRSRAAKDAWQRRTASAGTGSPARRRARRPS